MKRSTRKDHAAMNNNIDGEYKFVISKPYLDYDSRVSRSEIYGPETPLPRMNAPMFASYTTAVWHGTKWPISSASWLTTLPTMMNSMWNGRVER